jgi:hypothetical protein
LAELCREQFPQPIVWAMWVISEVAAMATDLAEFLGGAIGLALLFQMPLLSGMVVTAVVTYGILMFESSGFRPVELIKNSAHRSFSYFREPIQGPRLIKSPPLGERGMEVLALWPRLHLTNKPTLVNCTCGGFLLCMRHITMRCARTWYYRKMRPCIDQSTAWPHCRHPDLERTASSIRPDMIFGKDNGLLA